MARTSRRASIVLPWFVVTTLVSFEMALPAAAGRQAPPPAGRPALGCAAIEEFLRTARIVKSRDSPVGVTAPRRATLDDGTLQHDASVQAVDVTEGALMTTRGLEQNFRDSWKFNVAGYELAKMLELNMVPPYVERKVGNQQASVSWWINDTIMEMERERKKLLPPNIEAYVKQGFAANVFHELIRNTDANKTNVLISTSGEWRMWMIDFSRAFREDKNILNPKMLIMCDRKLLANLRALNEAGLKEKLGRWLEKWQIDGLLARRDLIVKFFEKEIAQKGEEKVLYDLPLMAEPCGTGMM